MSNEKLDTPVQYVKGVGPKLAKLFARLGVVTVEDLFYFCPRAYEDRTHIKPIRQLQPAEQEVVRGEIVDIDHHSARGRFSVLKVFLNDKTATIQAVFFNQPYLERTFRPGMRLIVSGRIEYSKFDGIMQVLPKDYEIDSGEPLKVIPIYHLTEGLYPKKLRSVVATALTDFLQYIDDPKDRAAIKTLHQPEEVSRADAARRHLAFRELFIFELGLLLRRKTVKEEARGIAYELDQIKWQRSIDSLPFKLTAAQNRVLSEIVSDMRSPRPMHRLLQGDVGSGKTVIAALAALLAQRNGYQTAILAPTEILANQHFEKIGELLKGERVTLRLSTQATGRKQKVKDKIIEEDIVIGTHALLEEKIKFKNLGLAIIDEQHRFGVEQRTTLIRKGEMPDILVMTATPIPRSLALTLYGDLDRSIIDEMPPGRIPIKTHYVPESKRASAYDFLRQKMNEGRQVFVICPLVEGSEELDLKAASDEAERLQKDIFPELRVGLIHGRQKSAERDRIMQQFRDHKIDILVSTTVIEVGNGGLLYHFGSKEQLLLAVLQELTLRQTDRVRSTLEPETRAAARQGTSLAAALEILRLFVMFSVSDPELAQLAVILQSEARDPSHPAHNYFREQEEMVRGIFLSLLAPYVDDPRSAARHVYALMDGLEGQWLRSGQAFDLLEEWDRAIARILPEKTIAGEGI